MTEDNPTPEADDTAEVLDAQTAMLVFTDADGNVVGTNALREVIIEHNGKTVLLDVAQHAGPEDMWRMATEVVRDLDTQRVALQTANLVMQGQMQMAQRMQQVAEEQRIKEATGLTVPGRS